ncbi:MAG: rolling circle replication-associated protein [Gaiellaceae bacterium]
MNRLGTLTYAGRGCHDPRELRRNAAGFFKGLRVGLGGKRLPYLWVPEWHPGGHGLHVHFAVGRFIKRGLIDDAWGRGYVHIKLLGDLPVGSGTLEESRLSGRYLAKYAAKAMEDERRVAGLHRYEVAQNFQPAAIECYGPTAHQAIESASRYMGRPPATVWLSSSVEDWGAPPSCWAAWND